MQKRPVLLQAKLGVLFFQRRQFFTVGVAGEEAAPTHARGAQQILERIRDNFAKTAHCIISNSPELGHCAIDLHAQAPALDTQGSAQRHHDFSDM